MLCCTGGLVYGGLVDIVDPWIGYGYEGECCVVREAWSMYFGLENHVFLFFVSHQ